MPRHLYKRAPETQVELLAQSVRRHLYLPDPGALYVLMGAVAGSMMEGSNIYLMLVGPPASGGSLILDLLKNIPGMVNAGLVESPAAFLSASGKRDRAKDATGGLLGEVGKHGALIMKDFTSILNLEPKTRRSVMGVLREAFDGKWSRPVGTDGGKNLQWEGRINAFGKCTGEIDQQQSNNAGMGERWVYYRFPTGDVFAQARQALLNAGKSKWRDELQCLTHAMFEAIDLKYGGRAGVTLAPRRELTSLEISRIINLASIASRCRSGVSRDSYKHDVIGVPEQENPTRLSEELQQIYIGMEMVGVNSRVRWQLIEKVAMDSMPKLRRLVVDHVRIHGEASYDQLTKVIGCSASVVARGVEDLELHGVVKTRLEGKGLKVEGDKSKVKISLSEWMEKEWRSVRKAHE